MAHPAELGSASEECFVNGRAPGWPGIEPRWASIAKRACGTALCPACPAGFTLGLGRWVRVCSLAAGREEIR